MKYVWLGVLAIVFAACQGNTQEKVQLKTQKDSVSYSIGLDVGRNLKQQMIDIDPVLLGRGIRDIIDSVPPALTEEQVQACMTNFQQQVMAKHQDAMKTQSDKNKKEGEAFLASNKTKDGVVTLPDGLQYKILKAGTGKKPSATQTVSVNYRGTLLDGTEFDNSYKRGQPAEFPLNGVIKGWTEALQLMPVGSKWQLFLPPELAYGERGAGGLIGPNATLVFEVELLEIK
ncbi:MAG TPA: FKBP-type peptidyl-prolyl cis-trans isomerase [Bacteroidota bacterium]|nr:FKBP-type peptidyl-prolyl cis-trans isomerase [Bacteroidota bacterium]